MKMYIIKEGKMYIIQEQQLTEKDRWSLVTYIPDHANMDVNHSDSVPCVLIQIDDIFGTGLIMVLNCNTRTRQKVNPKNPIWG